MASTLRFDDEELARVRQRLQGLSRRQLDGSAPRAAVLVPLCTRGGEPAVLFTKRSETVGTHKGQVSFPGGRMDADDVDVTACALRELHEELGVRAERVQVLGLFHEVPAITGVHVTPVIGFLGPLEGLSLVPAPEEIDVVFALTLRELTDPQYRTAQQLGRLKAPHFSAGPHPVWGLTAFILDEVMTQALRLELPAL